MSLSNQSIESLLDLLDIKISQMDVFDRDDARELRQLERARDELAALAPGLCRPVPARMIPPPRVGLSGRPGAALYRQASPGVRYAR